jgi:hypothetical protein
MSKERKRCLRSTLRRAGGLFWSFDVLYVIFCRKKTWVSIWVRDPYLDLAKPGSRFSESGFATLFHYSLMSFKKEHLLKETDSKAYIDNRQSRGGGVGGA